ncbi:MAG: GreA/GreB family elongation factor [Rickettsiales bacterium]|jgi:transcription elongation GreA/GreB family factor|nr:GreA/GreB family elongation factor [Rickettsiales bacterium]
MDETQKVLITAEYLDALRAKSRALQNRVAEAQREKIQSYDGDTNTWHDNFAYEEAARQESIAKSELRVVAREIECAAVCPPPERRLRPALQTNGPDCVGIWTRAIIEVDGALREICIVPVGGEDISAGVYNYRTPFAAALLGARVGETRIIRIPAGDISARIIDIKKF